jgi:hypothetical protein
MVEVQVVPIRVATAGFEHRLEGRPAIVFESGGAIAPRPGMACFPSSSALLQSSPTIAGVPVSPDGMSCRPHRKA